MDEGLKRAFAHVERLLFGDGSRPGLTRSELERLVGYPVKGEGPLGYELPKTPELSGVQAVRFYYYPKDPRIQLIVEVEDLEGRRRLRHFRWNGFTWEASGERKRDLRSTEETLGLVRVGEDYFAGYTPEEAKELALAVRKGEAAGVKYLLCPKDGTRVFYAPQVKTQDLICPTCGNPTLLYKTLTLEAPKDPMEALLEEQRALRQAIEELVRYLRRKLGP
jgi:hypothetical protein